MMQLCSVALPLLALSLTGCGAERDAAAEAPVSMKGGLYSVVFEGSAFGIASPIPYGERTAEQVCVRYNEGDGWIYKAVRERASPGPRCRTEGQKRVGNAISASVVCQLKQEEGGGLLTLDYSGAISEEGVDLTGKVKSPDNLQANGLTEDEQAQLLLLLKVVDVSIRIRREGDC